MTEQKFVYVDANYLKELEETAKKVDYYKGIIDGINMVADRKTENSSEIPNNCEHITEDGVTCAKYPACDDCLDNSLNKVKGSERLVKGSEQRFADRKTEPTGYSLSPVDKDINVRSKDEPQACDTCKWGEWYRQGYDITMMDDECGGCCSWRSKWTPKDEPQTERIKTHDYCDICNHKGCGDCIANNLDDYCVPSGYEPITKTETQNSNLTFEKRTMRDCYNCKRYETEEECIECKFEPKDEPKLSEIPTSKCHYEPKDEPKTEVVMPKKCKGCDSASKIIEAYSRGFEDGADAVNAVKVKVLHKDYIEPYVTIEDEPQTDGILFKGNLKEGDYKLIKTTNGWVLEGDIAYCGEPQTEGVSR